MKKKSKILLISSLALLSSGIAVATPVVLTSCTKYDALDQFKCRLLSSYFSTMLSQLQVENNAPIPTVQAFNLFVNNDVSYQKVESYLNNDVGVSSFSSDTNNIYINLEKKFYKNSVGIPSSTEQFDVYVKDSQIILNRHKSFLSGPLNNFISQTIYDAIFNAYGVDDCKKINYGFTNILQANEILIQNLDYIKKPIVEMLSNQTDISKIETTSPKSLRITLTDGSIYQDTDYTLNNGVKLSKNRNSITLENVGMFSNELSDIDTFYANRLYSTIFNTNEPNLPANPKKLDFGKETLETATAKLKNLKNEIELSIFSEATLETKTTLATINNQNKNGYIQITFDKPVFNNNSYATTLILTQPQATIYVIDRTIYITAQDMFDTTTITPPQQP